MGLDNQCNFLNKNFDSTVASVLFYCTEKLMKILSQKFSPENCKKMYGVHSYICMI